VASDEQGERTEQATDAKREEFRKRGQVASTRELGTAFIFLAGALFITMFAQFYHRNIVESFEFFFGDSLVQFVRLADFSGVIPFLGLKFLYLLGPLFFAALFIGVASQVLQTGFLNIEDALTFDLNKINPLTALKRIFSLRGFVDFFKSVLKMALIFLVIYLLLKSEIKQIPMLSGYSINQMFSYIGSTVYKLLLGSGMLMLILAVADYFYQRWQIEQDMMMTKQEVKEEHKSREGDPLIKARIRKIQREVAMRKMMTEVPKGDVVITNPTHIAVVLKYSADLPAPQMIAKGADLVAEKIKEIAREHNIPVIENKPLARTIYKTMKIGQVIPKDLFVAVAEVLSYVYRLKKKKFGSKAKSNSGRSTDSRAKGKNNRRPPSQPEKGV